MPRSHREPGSSLLAGLAKVWVSNYVAIAFDHPSLPDYLDLVSGSNEGVDRRQPPSFAQLPRRPHAWPTSW